MTIRNTKLGGTDWVSGNILEAGDLNDTFDASTPLLHSGGSYLMTIGTSYATADSYVVPANTFKKDDTIRIEGNLFGKDTGNWKTYSYLHISGVGLTTGSIFCGSTGTEQTPSDAVSFFKVNMNQDYTDNTWFKGVSQANAGDTFAVYPRTMDLNRGDWITGTFALQFKLKAQEITGSALGIWRVYRDRA